MLSMLLCISGLVLVCLEYPSKHDKLHQGLDYIVLFTALLLFSLYYSSFESIDKYLNVFSLYHWMLNEYFCKLGQPKVRCCSLNIIHKNTFFLWQKIRGCLLNEYIQYILIAWIQETVTRKWIHPIIILYTMKMDVILHYLLPNSTAQILTKKVL